jgi:hypothetical protein
MYIAKEDLDSLSIWLDEEDDIAIIESIGVGKWQAKDQLNINSGGTYCLYHKPSGHCRSWPSHPTAKMKKYPTLLLVGRKIVQEQSLKTRTLGLVIPLYFG